MTDFNLAYARCSSCGATYPPCEPPGGASPVDVAMWDGTVCPKCHGKGKEIEEEG